MYGEWVNKVLRDGQKKSIVTRSKASSMGLAKKKGNILYFRNYKSTTNEVISNEGLDEGMDERVKQDIILKIKLIFIFENWFLFRKLKRMYMVNKVYFQLNLQLSL